ncbi:hypothetical protein BU14_3146s0001 [Porphyra umbilicalis]|uniref:Uncharacterized protein n=1 Tax=Porphyra umbilicalis TaxID=2786 RepID=A0A1X6NHZ9_PORUM|nr:hypothetical protein BU14_3146s0001 [Porphyra umbilicalis]|eukprot:OSX68247.1 hypothetical protein BU14_3146s0001 [Porphyra umbilicalis]
MCPLRTAVRPPDGREQQRPLLAVPVGSSPLRHRPARGLGGREAALFLALRCPSGRRFASTHAVVVCSPHPHHHRHRELCSCLLHHTPPRRSPSFPG